MKTQITETTGVFGVRLPVDLKLNFSRTARMTGFSVGSITADALRYYYGNTDELLMKRREVFLRTSEIVRDENLVRLNAELKAISERSSGPTS